MSRKRPLFSMFICLFLMPKQPPGWQGPLLYAKSAQDKSGEKGAGDGVAVKKVLDVGDAGENLLRPDAWRPWEKGFERLVEVFVCDNGGDAQAQRGVSPTGSLKQTHPEPRAA